MSAHTPGPWFIPAKTNAGSKEASVWAWGGEVRVADCNSDAITLAARRADARLIAAAPDLLEALDALINAPWSGTNVDKARAAIAKATSQR